MEAQRFPAFPAIKDAALAACDAIDGVQDSVIENPRRCNFDPAALLCSGADDLACLTSPQVEAVKKIFASGSPSGQLLVTTAVYDDPVAGATVLHLPVPLDGPGVHIHDNWRTMGMRATGSNDITIEGVFVPDHSVGVRRPKGKWHEFFDVHSAVVWPLVMSVYVGVAEAARLLALSQAAKRRDDPIVQGLVGEMDTHLAGAQVALREMVALGSAYDYQPNLERSNKVFVYKTIVARSALCAVERAMEVCGGASFFRSAGIERILRDIQGVRFHPWQERKQYVFSGRVALGLEPV